MLRRVYLPRGYYFGVTAATGDLADNHDVISVRVGDPKPMAAHILEDLRQRIEKDIADGVDDEERHDPQFHEDARGLDEDTSVIYSILAIITVVGIGIVIFFFVQENESHARTHFT